MPDSGQIGGVEAAVIQMTNSDLCQINEIKLPKSFCELNKVAQNQMVLMKV